MRGNYKSIEEESNSLRKYFTREDYILNKDINIKSLFSIECYLNHPNFSSRLLKDQEAITISYKDSENIINYVHNDELVSYVTIGKKLAGFYLTEELLKEFIGFEDLISIDRLYTAQLPIFANNENPMDKLEDNIYDSFIIRTRNKITEDGFIEDTERFEDSIRALSMALRIHEVFKPYIEECFPYIIDNITGTMEGETFISKDKRFEAYLRVVKRLLMDKQVPYSGGLLNDEELCMHQNGRIHVFDISVEYEQSEDYYYIELDEEPNQDEINNIRISPVCISMRGNKSIIRTCYPTDMLYESSEDDVKSLFLELVLTYLIITREQ